MLQAQSELSTVGPAQTSALGTDRLGDTKGDSDTKGTVTTPRGTTQPRQLRAGTRQRSAGRWCERRTQDAALPRTPPAVPPPSPVSPRPMGPRGLTGELCPRGTGVADAAQGEAAQAVVEQLAVAEAETQQDPIDLVLSWGLQKRVGRGFSELGHPEIAVPSFLRVFWGQRSPDPQPWRAPRVLAGTATPRCHLPAGPQRGQRGQYLPADEHRGGGVRGDGEDGGGLLGGCGVEAGGEAPEMPRAPSPAPLGTDPPAGW